MVLAQLDFYKVFGGIDNIKGYTLWHPHTDYRFTKLHKNPNEEWLLMADKVIWQQFFLYMEVCLGPVFETKKKHPIHKPA